MTKKQYLKMLEKELQALPIEEQKEALEYYSNYFDEADDDDKVMSELGSPETLAQAIKDKIACVPAKKSTKENDSEKEETRTSSSPFSEAAFSVSKDSVKNLAISLSAAEVVFIPGTEYKAEGRGITPENFRFELDNNGTLVIENNRRSSSIGFFNHSNEKHWHPRILISIPENAVVDGFNFRVGAASVKAKDVNLTCKRGFIDISAGALEFGNLYGHNIDIRCGMGSVKLQGALTGTTNVDCGMGEIKLSLQGNPEDYSCNYKVGLGDIKLNKNKKSGFGQTFSSTRKENHFSVNCGMGSVKINIQ